MRTLVLLGDTCLNKGFDLIFYILMKIATIVKERAYLSHPLPTSPSMVK